MSSAHILGWRNSLPLWRGLAQNAPLPSFTTVVGGTILCALALIYLCSLRWMLGLAYCTKETIIVHWDQTLRVRWMLFWRSKGEFSPVSYLTRYVALPAAGVPLPGRTWYLIWPGSWETEFEHLHTPILRSWHQMKKTENLVIRSRSTVDSSSRIRSVSLAFSAWLRFSRRLFLDSAFCFRTLSAPSTIEVHFWQPNVNERRACADLRLTVTRDCEVHRESYEPDTNGKTYGSLLDASWYVSWRHDVNSPQCIGSTTARSTEVRGGFPVTQLSDSFLLLGGGITGRGNLGKMPFNSVDIAVAGSTIANCIPRYAVVCSARCLALMLEVLDLWSWRRIEDNIELLARDTCKFPHRLMHELFPTCEWYWNERTANQDVGNTRTSTMMTLCTCYSKLKKIPRICL